MTPDYNRIVDLLFGVCILYALVCNIVILYVCLVTALRRIPTFVFITIGALVNILSLFFTPFNYFIQYLFHFNPRNMSLAWCKTSYFFMFLTIHWSVWLLVLSNLEIYLKVKFIKFRLKYSNTRTAIWSSFAVGLFFVIFNTPKIIFYAFEEIHNGTSTVRCNQGIFDYKSFGIAGQVLNAVFYLFLPVVFITVENILLIKELKKCELKLAFADKQRKKKHSENRRLAKTLLFISLAFIIVCLPRSVALILYVSHRSDFHYLLVKICNLLSYVYFNSTLFILLAKNSAFKKKFVDIFAIRSFAIRSVRV